MQKEMISSKLLIKASEETKDIIMNKATIYELEPGQTLLRISVIETHMFVVEEGSLRLLAKDPYCDELFTVGRADPGDIVGLVDLLRQESCEGAIARTKCKLIGVPLSIIKERMDADEEFCKSLNMTQSPCEGAFILGKIANELNPPPEDVQVWIREQLKKSEGKSIELLSSSVPGHEELVGKEINNDIAGEIQNISNIDLRYYKWYKDDMLTNNTARRVETLSKELNNSSKWDAKDRLDMESVGIRLESKKAETKKYQPIRAKGKIDRHLATLRTLARAYNTPCPVDVLEKALEASEERSGSVSIHLMGALIESMGLQTQLCKVNTKYLDKIELPVVISYKDRYALISEVKTEETILADAEEGWIKIENKEIEEELGENIETLVVKRVSDTPNKTFGWNWFTPVIKKFKWSLVQVLLASLFIQLFQLANPLLLQQIIDKVISQSNLSALQVLGGALVAAALLQGILKSVRQWMLIDTTDRMDLLLGSQVIDKLLRLPMGFFEKRPVGELSQRLGELANLRNFLTGTAITSGLDIVFAIIYIFIMLIYSPLLTAVALGTIPIYVTVIYIISPIYRKLLRRQAQFSAKTQSHLIETLSGIQTVKAQHFELNSRWRWQEKYAAQIGEGFKKIVLGTGTGEIGAFLNQLSSLLIVWVGVYQVVGGQMSLGQMIAFRIIAGYVTGPILRLSTLWQAFQQVEISMERLSDIVDQVPETGDNEENQIALPPIKGNIEFKDVRFKFGNSKDYQIDGIDLKINAGDFVGIVGQSGSGKSTLMKLLPRLYRPEEGKVLIDNYDIDKVSLASIRQQIGIVPQDCLLFEGTVRENITMNNPEAKMKM